MDGIKVVSIEVVDSLLVGKVILDDLPPANCEFAFYILRDKKRIHVQWYSEHTAIEFDTEGIPGNYQVIAFKRVDGTVLGSVKSAEVSANIAEAPPLDHAETRSMFRRLWK
jgi:hypothetical protein